VGEDVSIPLQDLERLNASLLNIIAEFEAAGSRANDLQGAIRAPHGEHDLRAEIDRFERAWDDKRETLRQRLEEIQQRVQGTAEGWSDFDTDLARNLDTSERTPQVEP
jgi:hypothetical protein